MDTPSDAALQAVIDNINHPVYGSGSVAQATEWLRLDCLTPEQRKQLEEALAQP